MESQVHESVTGCIPQNRERSKKRRAYESEELRRWLEQTRVHIGDWITRSSSKRPLDENRDPGHVQMSTNVITIDPSISDGNVLTVLLHEIIEASTIATTGSHHYVIKTYEVALFSFLVNNRN